MQWKKYLEIAIVVLVVMVIVKQLPASITQFIK
jgi:hypothetical protein